MIVIRHIVVACAVDSTSAYAVRYAIELAKLLNSKLTILHIVDTSRLKELMKMGLFRENEKTIIEQDLEAEGKRFVERFSNLAKEIGVECDVLVLWGTVHKQIAQVIREKEANLLVIGGDPVICESGKSTTGELILAESPCPVLVVKRPKFY